MKLRKVLAVGLLLGAVCATSGCNPFRSRSAAANAPCKEADALSEAQTVPALKIPAGLEAPDTRAALRVPDLSTPEPPRRTRSQGCLDEPPPYLVVKPKEPEA